jgi:hypothetical protein
MPSLNELFCEKLLLEERLELVPSDCETPLLILVPVESPTEVPVDLLVPKPSEKPFDHPSLRLEPMLCVSFVPSERAKLSDRLLPSETPSPSLTPQLSEVPYPSLMPQFSPQPCDDDVPQFSLLPFVFVRLDPTVCDVDDPPPTEFDWLCPYDRLFDCDCELLLETPLDKPLDSLCVNPFDSVCEVPSEVVLVCPVDWDQLVPPPYESELFWEDPSFVPEPTLSPHPFDRVSDRFVLEPFDEPSDHPVPLEPEVP